MVPRRRILGGCCLFISLAIASIARAENWPVPRGDSHEPVAYRYDPAQWKNVPKGFLEDAPACVLYAGSNYLIEKDGTVEAIAHEITRLNSRKAVEKLGEYRSISYVPANERLTLNVARVLKADGRSVPVEPKHLQLRDLETDYQVYDVSKQLVISFPNLEVGDAIEVKWTTRGKNPEHQGRWFTRYTFGDDQFPAVLDELRVRTPADMPLKYAAVGGQLDPVIDKKQGTCTYHWQARKRRQLPREDNLPSKEELRLQVACSTFTSWDEVLKWKRAVRADCWQCTPEIRQVVQETTRGLKTPEQKARTLTYWVRRRIRYVSAGQKHDYTPHAPATVLANRFGDCKDQSQLLAVMLREAGVPVALATLGTQDDGQILENVPSPWGTHAILLVTIAGKPHWIDTTVSQAGWDFLPRDDRDRLCYVVDDKGLRLQRTPRLTPEENRIEQTTRMWIGLDGSTRCERTATYQGLAALSRRDDWLEVPAGERRRLLTAELQDANSKAHLRRLMIDEEMLRNFDQPAAARIDFEVPRHFAGDIEREGSLTDSTLWGKLLAINLDYDRQVPLNLGVPFESVHHYTVYLPPGYQLDTYPRNKSAFSTWGQFSLSVAADPAKPRRLDLEFRSRIEKTRVAPADFAEFRKFHEEVFKEYRVWLTLKPANDLADAAVLEVLAYFTPGDALTAATLGRLYLDQGRRSDARRVLQRARYYCPNSAELGELSVQATADLQEEEAVYRELVRRFPKQPKYAVALGQTLGDRGQHAAAREILSRTIDDASPRWQAAAHYQLARSLFQQQKPAEALKELEAAEHADAESVRTTFALRLKGNLYQKLGDPKRAAATFQEALEMEPESAETLEALVRLHIGVNKRADALKYLRRYTVAAAKDIHQLVKAADFHLKLGRYDEAVDLASQARDIDFHAGAQRVLGLVHLRRGEYAKAVFHLDRAELDADVLEGLIRGYIALGRLRDAEQQVERVDRVTGHAMGLCRACALTIALVQRRTVVMKDVRIPRGQESEYAAAIDCFVCAEDAYLEGQAAARVESLVAAAFAGDVEQGPAYALRGLLALERGRLSKALADGERAVTLSPQEARGHFVRGRVRLERGMDGAVADLSRAAELSNRKDALVLHWLAGALCRGGRTKEALATQREALSLLPKDQEIAAQLREFEKSGQATDAAR